MPDIPIICPKCGEMGVQIEVIQTGGWQTHFCRTCSAAWPPLSDVSGVPMPAGEET